MSAAPQYSIAFELTISPLVMVPEETKWPARA
jgi:hypothetical protein